MMISHRQSDLLDTVKNIGVIPLVFEKGYSLGENVGSITYTFDCRNGRALGAELVPPIKGTVSDSGEILSCEHTNMIQQLWHWGYEVVGEIEYLNDKQQIVFKVKKK